MAESETLEALAAELHQLPARQRRQVLAALTTPERAALDRLLQPAPAPADLRSAADLAPRFSPWLGTRLRQAEEGTGPMTAAARRQLLRVAREAIEKAPAGQRSGAEKSLIQIFVGALSLGAAAS